MRGEGVLAEARHLGAARDVGEDLPGADRRPTAGRPSGLQMSKSGCPTDRRWRGTGRAVAHGVQELRAGHQRHMRQEVERVLRVGRDVLRLVERARQQGAFRRHPARWRTARSSISPLCTVDAGDEPVLEAADPALVVDAREAAVVVVVVVEPLEDRVHQVAVDAEAAELDAGAGDSRNAVLLAMRQESMLRCQSLATLMAAAVLGDVSATVLVTPPGNALRDRRWR